MKNKTVGLAVGASAVAAGVAAAGYYFYASKDAKANRQIAATWAKDMRREVESKVRTIGSVDKESFMKIIDRAADLYNGARKASTEEILRAAAELKENYTAFKKEMEVPHSSKKKAHKKA